MTRARPETPVAQDRIINLRRHGLAWRLVVPVCLALTAAVIAAWLIIPQIIASNAIEESISKSQAIAEQFKTIRGYYTDRVVSKVIKQGAMKATIDHKTNENAIPLPATMIQDLSDLLAQKTRRSSFTANIRFRTAKTVNSTPFSGKLGIS